ncbi:hypothetical protein D9M71_488190 [compost metagenome]
MLGPAAALALGQGSQAGTITRQMLFTFKNAAIEAGQEDVFDQGFDTPQLAVQQTQFSQPRKLAAQEFGRLGQLLQEQALQGAAVLELGLGLGRETPFLDRTVFFHQGRVHGHR